MLNIPEYKEYGGETKIALMDNSSLAFMHELSQKSYPSDRILSVYDLILIPKWVMEEIEDSTYRSTYVEQLQAQGYGCDAIAQKLHVCNIQIQLPTPLRMVLLLCDSIRSRGEQINLMQPFPLANIHQGFLQVLQIVFGKVVLISSLAVDWPFGVGLRLYIEFAQAVDYDVGMDIACAIIAICMGTDQSLMPRKISLCVFQPDGLRTFSC